MGSYYSSETTDTQGLSVIFEQLPEEGKPVFETTLIFKMNGMVIYFVPEDLRMFKMDDISKERLYNFQFGRMNRKGRSFIKLTDNIMTVNMSNRNGNLTFSIPRTEELDEQLLDVVQKINNHLDVYHKISFV